VSSARGGAGSLIETVEQLWPHGRVVDAVDGQVPDATTYAFVPNASEARFLLPLHDRASAGEALRKYSSSLTVREIAQRALMSLAFRCGASVLLRDRLAVSGEQESLRSYLSEVLGQEVIFSINVGTARVNRKPILQVFSTQGTTLGYVKVGNNPMARADVQAEAAALRRIEGRLPARLEAPGILHTGQWRDAFILLLTPLRISMWQRPGGQTVVPTTEMRLLSEAFPEPDQPLTESTLWAGLLGSMEVLEEPATHDRVAPALEALAARAGDRPLRFGAWHGDWTSWNMARGHDRILLWDWERFETGVLRGFDHCHFVVNAQTRRRTFDAATILAALRGLQPVGQDAAAAEVTVGVYLARLALRYSLAAEGPTGSLIADRARSVVEALDEWVKPWSR